MRDDNMASNLIYELTEILWELELCDYDHSSDLQDNLWEKYVEGLDDQDEE